MCGLNIVHSAKFFSAHASLRSMDVAKYRLIFLHKKKITPTKTRLDRGVTCYHAHVCNVPTLQGSHLMQFFTKRVFLAQISANATHAKRIAQNKQMLRSCTKPMCPKTERGNRRTEPLSKTIHKMFFFFFTRT